MLAFLFGNSIRARVLRAISARIKAAEERFAMKCEEIDEAAELQKEQAADTLVSDILGR